MSSSAVTEGAGAGTIVTEKTNPAPRSRYGWSKWAAEHMVRDASRSGMPVVVARPVWVYGWRSPGAVKLFRLINRRRMVMIGAASNAIQPIAVDDLVAALIRAAAVEGIEGEVYQFAGPAPVTVKRLCADIADALHVVRPFIHMPMPLARAAAAAFERWYPVARGKPPIDSNKIAMFQTDHRYSNAKGACDLGWTPSISVREGVTRAAAGMRAHGLLK